MLERLQDTIVAPITGLASAPVAVIRVSGAEAWAVASRVFPSWPSPVEPRRMVYGKFVHGDDGYAVAFAEGASYTGDESAEFFIHGSVASVQCLLEACLGAGARSAAPGEFTYRALMNGRIDLSQAEGVAATLTSQTDAQLRLANHLRERGLKSELAPIREAIEATLVAIEASVDFSEEIGELDRPSAVRRLEESLTGLEALLARAKYGRIWQRGATVVIVGPPNVGKSSLLNAVLGADRALVTPIPGTTRDAIEGHISIEGLPVRLMDTAGLRDTLDAVEILGIRQTHFELQFADLVWIVFDGRWMVDAEIESLVSRTQRPYLRVANKMDLVPDVGPIFSDPPWEGDCDVSAKTGKGIPELLRATRQKLVGEEIADLMPLPRHFPLLLQAQKAVRNASETLSSEVPDDLATVHLREALHALGEITGETASMDLLERIFREFCIGK